MNTSTHLMSNHRRGRLPNPTAPTHLFNASSVFPGRTTFHSRTVLVEVTLLSHYISSPLDLTGFCTISVRRESATCAAASTVVSPVLSHTGDTSTCPASATSYVSGRFMLTNVSTDYSESAQSIENTQKLSCRPSTRLGSAGGLTRQHQISIEAANL